MTFVSSAIMLLTNHHGNEHWLWINWQQRGKTHKVDEHHTQRRWLMTLAASTMEASATWATPGFTLENIQPEEPGLRLARVVKNPPANAGDIKDVGSVSGLRRSPGGGHATHSASLPGESHGQRSLEATVCWSHRAGHD